MIPGAIILASLNLAMEMLRAWNTLKPEQRDAIVDRWIKDDEMRRTNWEKFTGWVGGLPGKVQW